MIVPAKIHHQYLHTMRSSLNYTWKFGRITRKSSVTDAFAVVSMCRPISVEELKVALVGISSYIRSSAGLETTKPDSRFLSDATCATRRRRRHMFKINTAESKCKHARTENAELVVCPPLRGTRSNGKYSHTAAERARFPRHFHCSRRIFPPGRSPFCRSLIRRRRFTRLDRYVQIGTVLSFLSNSLFQLKNKCFVL